MTNCLQSGNLQGSPLTNELQKQETILKQCIDQLRSVESTRASLIAYLKEGLDEQVQNFDLDNVPLLFLYLLKDL